MAKYKKTSRKTVTVVETYHLTKEIKYCIETVNNKEKKRFLKYTGKKHNDYELKPIYKEDLSLLETTNPCWNDFDWLKGDELPGVEDIDVSKIIYSQFSTHSFFDQNKEPIPVYHLGSYLTGHISNQYYDLEELKKYLDTHPNVTNVSEILEIPYYNYDEDIGQTHHIEVGILPTIECLKKAPEMHYGSKSAVFGEPWVKNGYDFLGIKKFLK
jgi:hypothetical protein